MLLYPLYFCGHQAFLERLYISLNQCNIKDLLLQFVCGQAMAYGKHVSCYLI